MKEKTTFDALYIFGTILAKINGGMKKHKNVLRGKESWYKLISMSHSQILS